MREPSARGPLRAVIYARVSSDPKKQGKSVADQIKEGKEECLGRGWTVVRMFQDNDRSASRHASKERPEYDKLIDYLRAGHADVLVTRESSRAQRDLDVYVELRKICADIGVLWCYKGRVHDLRRTDDRFTTGLDALLAEREADEVKDRVVRGQRGSADAGRPPGRCPFGYRRQYDPHTKALIGQVIREDQAAIVREAARRYAAGESIAALVRDFNQRGVPTQTGGTWANATVRRLITNPVYLGKRIYQGKIHGDGNWEPILDPITFHACARRLDEMKIYGGRDQEPKYLLSHVVKCGQCGGPLGPIPTSRRPSLHNYTCRGTPFATGGCVSILVHRLDAHITELVLERLGRADAAELLADDAQDEELLAAIAESEELRARHREFIDKAAEGKLSAEALARIEEKLLPKIQDAERRTQAVNLSPALRGVVRPDIREIWPTLSVSHRREIVRSLMDITLHRAPKKGRTAFDPERVRVVWKHDI